MAVTVAFSNLMVLIATVQQSFDSVWNTIGGVNDPTADKHKQAIEIVVTEGNYRSAMVDNWQMLSFDSVSVYGMNTYGDVFWETEFNKTGTTWALSSWLLGDRIISSSAEVSGIQTAIHQQDNYALRLSPVADKSWFAVSSNGLSYGGLPLFFVPRSPSVPFDDPPILDGLLGCWELNDLINVVFKLENAVSMTANWCVVACWDEASLAVLVNKKNCYCADVEPGAPPTNYPSICYLDCTGSTDECGGYSTTAGSAYHVQGSTKPGHLDTLLFYRTTRLNVNTTVQISDIYAATGMPMYISRIIVNATGSTSSIPAFTVQYNESNCADSGGYMKIITSSVDIPKRFWATGIPAEISILKVRCIELVLNAPADEVVVELWGPDSSADHVGVPALVIRGKVYTEVTTTSTTSTSTTTPTTTTTATTTTTVSTTTSTTQSTTTSSSPSTTSSTSTTTTLPPTTTTSTTLLTTTTTPPATTSSTTSSISSSSTASSTLSGSSTTTPSPTTLPSSSSTTLPTCHCPCNISMPHLNLTTEQLQEKIVEIQRRLAVNVSELSSTIRKLTSAEDSRVSAVSIGYVGVGILVSIVASIVFIDSAMIIRDLKKLFDNIRTGLCAKEINPQS